MDKVGGTQKHEKEQK